MDKSIIDSILEKSIRGAHGVRTGNAPNKMGPMQGHLSRQVHSPDSGRSKSEKKEHDAEILSMQAAEAKAKANKQTTWRSPDLPKSMLAIIDNIIEKSHSSRIGNASPSKGAAGRHFAREAREDQKKEDAKYRVPRRSSVLGSGGEVTNVSDKVVRVRPPQGGTVGSEAKIKSIATDLMKSVDAILEKAGIRRGRPAKDQGAAGPVKKVSLSEEQKKKYLEGSAAKVKAYRTEGYMPDRSNSPEVRAQDRSSSNKSLDERTADLAKSMYDIVNHRRFSKMDPDAGIDKKKEEKMDAEGVGTKNPAIKDGGRKWTSEDKTQKSLDSDLEKGFRGRYDDSDAGSHAADVEEHRRKTEPKSTQSEDDELDYGPEDKGKYVPGSKTFNNPQDSQNPKTRYKSLDERTCNLTKDMSQQREREIHDAVSTIRMTQENVPEAAKMDVKAEDVHRAHTLHTNLAAPRTQKSVCNTWQTESAFISKGGRIVVQGGEPATLVKDEQRPARTPSLHQTDKKQEDVQSGKIERERKAKKRIADLGAE